MRLSKITKHVEEFEGLNSGILSSKEGGEKKDEHQSELKRSAQKNHVGEKSGVAVHRKSMKKVKEKGLSGVSHSANVSSKITSKN